MCNLYRLDVPANQIADAFGIDSGHDPWPGDYVAPGKFAPVIIRADGQKVLVPRVWGVPPPPNGDRPVTNVRNLDSPFWIGTLRHTMFRCLIPVTSFQEWGGERGKRTQHWFSVPSEPVFAIAGIWRDSEVASYAMLTHMIAHVCNLGVGTLTISMGDVHIYKNHFSQVKEQLSRIPGDLPELWLNPDIKDIFDFGMNDIKLVGYNHQGAIKAPMAV